MLWGLARSADSSRTMDARRVVAVMRLSLGISQEQAVQILRPAVVTVLVDLDAEVEIPDKAPEPEVLPESRRVGSRKRGRKKRIFVERVEGDVSSGDLRASDDGSG